MRIASFNCMEEYGKSSLAWYRYNANCQNIFGYYTGFSIYKNAIREGVVLYTNFSKTNVDMHWHLPKCLNRWLLGVIFKYPFDDLGLHRITGFVNSNNITLNKILPKLGFELEATVKDYYNLSEHMLIYMVAKDNQKLQKWIR